MTTSKERYHFLKSHHLCVTCGKPITSYARCDACRLKNSQYNKAYFNGCDWHDCSSCPHDECIADENLIDKRMMRHREISRENGRRNRRKKK